MVGHQWLPWINNPAQGAISVTSAKQEQEISSGCLHNGKKIPCHRLCSVVGLSALCLLLFATCAALSVLYTNETDRKPAWKSLLHYHNMSDSYLSLTKANSELKKHNDVMEERGARLEEQARLLNRTSAGLEALNLALSLESSELAEQIANLTSANAQLSRERDARVRLGSELEERTRHLSETVARLTSSNARLQEEGRRLSEESDLLRDELLRTRGENRELAEISHELRGEIRSLAEVREEVSRLQEQNLNLSRVLVSERRDAAEQGRGRSQEMERMEAEVRSMTSAYRALDLYCPVVNQKTGERLCRKCQESWRLFETKCYYFSSRSLTWSSSRAWCRTQGGDLLVVNSPREQDFIFDTSRALDQSGTRLWIGLTDAEVEGEWRWVDGSRVAADLQYWLSRPGMGTEPDDWKLDDPLGEDCGHVDTSENTLTSWMDGSCKIPYRWICEKNI